MKEKLINIVHYIDSCAKVCRGKGITPIARVNCIVNDKEETYWFTNKYVNLYGQDNINDFGRFVPKNSNVAIKMQTSDIGTSFEYEQKNNIKRMLKYCVQLENRSDLQQQTISIAGDSTLYQYRNISEFLKDLTQNEKNIRDKESEIAVLTQRKEDLKGQKGTATERGLILLNCPQAPMSFSTRVITITMSGNC
jgi:hypothetical protein